MLWPASKVAQGRALGNGCILSLACGPSDTPESFLSSVPEVHAPPSQGLGYTGSWISKCVRHWGQGIKSGLYRVSLFSTTMNDSNCDRSTFEPKSRARERACANIRGGMGQDGSIEEARH